MEFRSTEEAEAYGRTASVAEIAQLKRDRESYIGQCQAIALVDPRGAVTGLDERRRLAVQAQLCREAIEAGGFQS